MVYEEKKRKTFIPINCPYYRCGRVLLQSLRELCDVRVEDDGEARSRRTNYKLPQSEVGYGERYIYIYIYIRITFSIKSQIKK